MGPRTPGMSPQRAGLLAERMKQAAADFAEAQEELIRYVQHSGGQAVGGAVEADRAYNINNAAKQLDLSRGTVYRLINTGHLKPIKYPGIQGYRITSKEIARFLARCPQD